MNSDRIKTITITPTNPMAFASSRLSSTLNFVRLYAEVDFMSIFNSRSNSSIVKLLKVSLKHRQLVFEHISITDDDVDEVNNESVEESDVANDPD